MLRALRVRSPVWNHHASSAQRAPTAVTCGDPSALIVVSQQVWRLGPPVSGVVVNSSRPAVTAFQSRGGRSYSAPRFFVSTIVLLCLYLLRRATIGKLIG